MIKKTITYRSLFESNEEVTEDFWFHITKADMVGMKVDEAFEARIQRVIEAKDNSAIYIEFKKMIELSVGRRDGEQFIRTPEFTNAFMSSPAFDELIMELLTSPDQGSHFIAGILPHDMRDAAIKEVAQINSNKETAVDPFDETPAWIKENREPTSVELRNMTREQLQDLWARKTNAEGS